MTTYAIGDAFEFELAPDGYCSRWTFNGKVDRGATDRWQRAVVEQVVSLMFGRVEVVAETQAGDRYHFEVATYGGAYGYPSCGLRLVTTARASGKVRLVERTDPVAKTRYYATTSTPDPTDAPTRLTLELERKLNWILDDLRSAS